jgi:thiol-disulfide isomerase/thioredoxin
MKPLVEGLEKTYKDTIEIRRYNVETDQTGVELAQKLGVQYVPTFLFVTKDGVVSKTLVGEQSEQGMVAALDALK